MQTEIGYASPKVKKSKAETPPSNSFAHLFTEHCNHLLGTQSTKALKALLLPITCVGDAFTDL